jgi:hypothetical protein
MFLFGRQSDPHPGTPVVGVKETTFCLVVLPHGSHQNESLQFQKMNGRLPLAIAWIVLSVSMYQAAKDLYCSRCCIEGPTELKINPLSASGVSCTM